MIIILFSLLLSGCVFNQRDYYDAIKNCPTKTYTITNSHGTFTVCPQKHFIFDEVGMASFYDSGKITATQEKFNANHLTAAHPYLPLPCVAEVSEFGKPWNKVIVKINDRGPFTKKPRIIDLSLGAAKKMNFVKEGVMKVRVRVMINETLQLKEHGGKIKWNGEKPHFLIFPRRIYNQPKVLNKIKQTSNVHIKRKQ